MWNFEPQDVSLWCHKPRKPLLAANLASASRIITRQIQHRAYHHPKSCSFLSFFSRLTTYNWRARSNTQSISLHKAGGPFRHCPLKAAGSDSGLTHHAHVDDHDA